MAPTEQTAVLVKADGGGGTEDIGSIVEVGKVPVVPPADGEVLVRLTLRPINPSDYYRINGTGGAAPSYPWVAGNEGLGIVEENGPGASKFKPGQRVVGVGWPSPLLAAPGKATGTYQQYLAAPEDTLLAIPDSIDDKAASQFLVNPVTAFAMLETLAVPKGQWLLQTAAGSVLGRMVVALAKEQGIKTINVVRRLAQKAELQELGADEVIATDSEDTLQRVAEITGGSGAYGALDAVGGDTLGEVVQAIREEGTVLLYGRLAGPTATIPVGNVLYRGINVTGFALPRWLRKKAEAGQKDEALQQVLDLFVSGVLRPFSGDSFPLERAVEAIQKSQEPARGGKVFLEG